MTPAGTSNELDVQNEWEENTQHTHRQDLFVANTLYLTFVTAGVREKPASGTTEYIQDFVSLGCGTYSI